MILRVTIRKLKKMKRDSEKIAMLTAYDYTSAKILDATGIPVILVGDSVGQWLLGYETTIPVTMDDMVHHTKAVTRGAKTAHIVADMPFMSYQADSVDALRNAGRLIKEGGAQSVKLEGGITIAETVRGIVAAGVPVMGHIGFTPQSVNQLGGNIVQGKFPNAAASLIEDALALQSAGAYSIVLEMVPAELAAVVTKRLSVPTIGIAAGVHCDGQVQVFHDLLGLIEDFSPKHARPYAQLSTTIKKAVSEYVNDVESQKFPSDTESHHIKPELIEQITTGLSA